MNEYKEFLLKQREAQSKFDYFFLGLCLAFLAITFQTYKKSTDISYDYLILITWVLMLLSIFSGLYRQRRVYVLMEKEADKIKYTDQLELDLDLKEFFKTAIGKDQEKLVISGRIQLWSSGFSFLIYLIYQLTNIYPSLLPWLKLNPN